MFFLDKRIGELRYKGPLPKVGIRPTVDGRRGGVREALEDRTRELAENVAKLIEENVRHPNGLNVECVISPIIGGVTEAAEAERIFASENVGLSITVTPSWCYGIETMDVHPFRPKAVFGFNGTERPGAVYLAAVLAGHAQKGLPAFGIYGRNVQDPEDMSIPPDVADKLLRFTRAGLAVARMYGKTYLSIGYVSMGIAGSMVDDSFFSDYLGMRVQYVDMSEIKRRLELGIYDPEEAEKAIKWFDENCRLGKDPNAAANNWTEDELKRMKEISVKMAIIIRDMMVGNPRLKELDNGKYGEEALGYNAILAGFQGQRHWTDFMPNGDFAEAILNSSFDWTGIRQPYLLATENDSLNGVCMLFGHLLTGTAQIFADVRTYWSPEAVKRVTGMDLPDEASDGVIHLINSGPAALDGTGKQRIGGKPAIKPFWEVTEEEVEACLSATEWMPAIREYFRGGGYSTHYLTEGDMPVTLSRISLVKNLGPVMQIAEGYTVELPPKMHRILDDRTNNTWPTTWFVPRLTGKGAFVSVYSVMRNWSANHGVLTYGHIGADLITLASILRIPVAMHNVPSDKLFRPDMWKLFGTECPEHADFTACRLLGPLYGKNCR